MPDNMVKELMKVPCQVVNQAQYPPIRKESDDTCFYTKENITKILNATRKSTYKVKIKVRFSISWEIIKGNWKSKHLNYI